MGFVDKLKSAVHQGVDFTEVLLLANSYKSSNFNHKLNDLVILNSKPQNAQML